MICLSKIPARATLVVPSLQFSLFGKKFKLKNIEIIEQEKSLLLLLPYENIISVYERSKVTDFWTKSKNTCDEPSVVFCRVDKTMSKLALKIVFTILENYSNDLPRIEEYIDELLAEDDAEYNDDLTTFCDQLQDGIWESVFTLQRVLKKMIAKKRWKLALTFISIRSGYQQFVEDYYAPPTEIKPGGKGYVLAKQSFKCKAKVLFDTFGCSFTSVDLNVQNVGMETVIGNSDAYTNLDTLGCSFPSMDLKVQNVGMETVIGNWDVYTNLVTLDDFFSRFDLNTQNVGMETETVIGNLDASVIVPNVAMETVIGNSDAYTNLVPLDGFSPNLDLSIQNVGMKAETVIGDLDACVKVPDVGMETVIGNSDAYTNLVTLGDFSRVENIQNVRMETVIENSDAYTNDSPGDVIGGCGMLVQCARF